MANYRKQHDENTVFIKYTHNNGNYYWANEHTNWANKSTNKPIADSTREYCNVLPNHRIVNLDHLLKALTKYVYQFTASLIFHH